jgi:hypothetical protein
MSTVCVCAWCVCVCMCVCTVYVCVIAHDVYGVYACVHGVCVLCVRHLFLCVAQ